MLIVLRTLRLGFEPADVKGIFGTLAVEACWIFVGIVGDLVGSAEDTARDAVPGRGREIVEADGDEGEEREDLRVLATGSEGRGVFGGPNDGRGSAVVAVMVIMESGSRSTNRSDKKYKSTCQMRTFFNWCCGGVCLA
jgi:hypothetical protein